MPRSSWCDVFVFLWRKKKNRPFTKLSVTWKSSAVVFLACCVFHLEAARVAFPGRHGCILVIMQVNVGWFFSDVVENWHHIALKEMIYDLKIKNRHNRRGHTWCHLNSTSGWEQERYRVTELGVTATGLGQVASFCPSVLLEMNVTPGSQCICEDEWW